MAGRGIFGSSFSMSNEFNFKGKKTEMKSRGEACIPVSMSEAEPPADNASFVPLILGALPACSGAREPSPLEQSVMGAVSAAGRIGITQDSLTSRYICSYSLPLKKVVNGAVARSGRISGDELNQLLQTLMDGWLGEPGSGFISYKQILAWQMQKAVLPDFMKGLQGDVCAMTGDPVNANTGNFVYEKEDLLISDREQLCFRIFYNSMDKRSGTMGMGWRHNYEVRLMVETDRYTILREDGREEVFLRYKGDAPEPLFGLPCRLTLDKDGYIYEAQKGAVYCFDRGGMLFKRVDPDGRELLFSYDKNGRLSRLRSHEGNSLLFEYDPFSGYLTGVRDQEGRRAAFAYEINRLKQASDAAGQVFVYEYGTDKRVRRIRNQEGVYVVENTYDNRGRTIRQRFADGSEMRFDYQDYLNRTLVTERDGAKTAYIHDGMFRNVETICAR